MKRPVPLVFPRLAVAVAFTAICLIHCIRHGKMRMYPVYDDVSYFADALEWMDTAHGAGISGVLRRYLTAPPHAPLHTLSAAAAFFVAGVHAPAACALNGLILVALLALADRAIGAIALPYRLSLWLLVLSAPIANMAVISFRPDISCALATAGAVMLLTERKTNQQTWRLAGVLLGLALLLKPSVFPFTLLVAGATLSLRLFPRPVLGQRDKCLLRSVLLPIICLALLYYPVGLRPTIRYIRDNVAGADSAIWRPAHGAAANALYFLTGLGGQLMLGRMLYVFAVFAGIGLVIALRDRRSRTIAARRLLLLALSYLLPTANPTKNEFLGATFQILLIFIAISAMADMLRRWETRAIPAGLSRFAMCALVGALAAIGCFQHASEESQAIISRQRSTIDATAAVLKSAPDGATIFVAPTGSLNAHTLSFVMHARGQRLRCVEEHRARSAASMAAAIDHADWVIVSEQDNPDLYMTLPSNAIQGQVMTALNADARFIRRASISPGYVVFQRQ